VLAGGFVYAGGQHFAALKFGYGNEGLRREHDRLVEEQRRLLLAREEAASPSRLERAARQLGLQPLQAGQIEPVRKVSEVKREKNLPGLSRSPDPKASDSAAKVTRPIRR